METIKNILHNYGVLGVEMLKSNIAKVSATGKTADSIDFDIKSTNDSDTLVIYGREFISALETGRGPRKSSTEGGMKDNILEWMQARGIGTDLDDKKKKQLARFLTLKINKEGDKTFKQGGREVYSKDLEKFVEALKKELHENYKLTFRNFLKETFNGTGNISKA